MQRVTKIKSVPSMVAIARGKTLVAARMMVAAKMIRASGAFLVFFGASMVSLMMRKLSSSFQRSN
jgi:hypothetical protein